MDKNNIKHIPKPWGYEEILEQNDHYVIKKLFIKKGFRLSKQYHNVKTETLLLVDGRVDFHFNGASVQTSVVGTKWHIEPGTVHRMGGITDVTLLEVSTTELDDVVRLEDDFDRIDLNVPS